MAIRNEIKDLILAAARRVLQNEDGELSPTDEDRLRANLDARIPLYTGRYPILGLLNELEAMADAGHGAAVVRQRGPSSESAGCRTWDWTTNWANSVPPSPTSGVRRSRKAQRKATQEYFQQATVYFDAGQSEQATESLCSAIACSIAATAALLGWPHRDKDDDLRVVVGLGTGAFPPEGASIYKLLQSASEQGQDLNSAFAAAMGQPTAVRTGAYDDAGRTSAEAFLFARTAVDLADQLGRRLR